MGIVIWILTLAADANGPACIVVDGSAITAGTVASAVPVFGAIPAETVLGFAPQAGIRRSLAPRELNAWLRRFLPAAPGVDVSATPCIVSRSRRLDREDVERAVRRALGSKAGALDIQLASFSRVAVTPGDLHFDPSLLPRAADPSSFVVWKGTSGGVTARPQHIWARVRIRERGIEPFAARDLRRGEPQREGDIEWRQVWRVPGAASQLPREMLPDSTWRRSLKQGESVRASDLQFPQLVHGGDQVDLELAEGPVALRVRASARTSGQPGQSVLVSSPLSKRPILGIVRGKGHVVAIPQ
jgi:flagella basal body P-ring formation protein FlgA